MLLPLLHRVLTVTARAAGRTQQLATELALAMHQPVLERQTLDQQYAKQRQYRAAKHQQQGLWPFEARMVVDHLPPPPARLLLHGAGGGRELRALLALGYQVDAYEPVAALVAAANAGLPGPPRVQQATVQQWANQPSGHYDAVITGWGMWTHLLQQADRLVALRAFLTVCPTGPVLVSFWRAGAVADHQERPQDVGPLHPPPKSWLQRMSRQWLRQTMLQLPPLERGTSWRQGLFVHLVSEAELEEEAAMAGYAVGFLETDRRRYGHAILRPNPPENLSPAAESGCRSRRKMQVPAANGSRPGRDSKYAGAKPTQQRRAAPEAVDRGAASALPTETTRATVWAAGRQLPA